MKAMNLVAGEGTRLRPLTLDRPKSMLPVAGRPMDEALRSVPSRDGVIIEHRDVSGRPTEQPGLHPGLSAPWFSSPVNWRNAPFEALGAGAGPPLVQALQRDEARTTSWDSGAWPGCARCQKVCPHRLGTTDQRLLRLELRAGQWAVTNRNHCCREAVGITASEVTQRPYGGGAAGCARAGCVSGTRSSAEWSVRGSVRDQAQALGWGVQDRAFTPGADN
jgi:hypothetical protein